MSRTVGWKGAYIGLGADLGERRENCESVLALLRKHPCIHIITISNWYETKALTLPGEQHPDYINGVVQIETMFTPHELLRVCKEIETQMGRVPSALRWQPHPIDLDILLYGDIQM